MYGANTFEGLPVLRGKEAYLLNVEAGAAAGVWKSVVRGGPVHEFDDDLGVKEGGKRKPREGVEVGSRGEKSWWNWPGVGVV